MLSKQEGGFAVRDLQRQNLCLLMCFIDKLHRPDPLPWKDWFLRQSSGDLSATLLWPPPSSPKLFRRGCKRSGLSPRSRWEMVGTLRFGTTIGTAWVFSPTGLRLCSRIALDGMPPSLWSLLRD
jgi:hypothetical protein